MQNQQWQLKTRPQGLIGEEHFERVVSDLPGLEDGGVLVKNLYLSFDPTQRGWVNDTESYMPPVAIGEVMRAGTVGQVVSSKNERFKVGDLVQGLGGWQEYFISDQGTGLSSVPEGVTPQEALGIFGTTGLTAYFGLLDLSDPKPGDTVLISGDANHSRTFKLGDLTRHGTRRSGSAGD